MMAKIVKGSDFKGAVDYIIDKKKDTQIVASEGLFMENLETIAMSFNAQSRMNDKVTKPVGHIALSFSKEDELRLTNRIMAGIALEYMERMGIKNTQFFIAQHFDKEHPHVHIAFNRIDNNGNTISDRHERLRSTRICKELSFPPAICKPYFKVNSLQMRLAYGWRKGQCQTQPPERARQDEICALRHHQNGSRQMRQLERAYRQPETAGSGSTFQA